MNVNDEALIQASIDCSLHDVIQLLSAGADVTAKDIEHNGVDSGWFRFALKRVMVILTSTNAHNSPIS
jgi:hypothetical protein